MRITFPIATFLFCGMLQVAFAQNPNPSATLDNFILGEMELENIPGMSTVIVKNGDIVWQQSYGLADVENNVATTDSTIFLLASISKLFVGTALMQLHEDEQIDLDEDIDNHLPFTISNPNFPSTPITFRMLMTHTSAIRENGPVMNTYYSTGDPTLALSEVMERYFSVNGSDYDAQNNFHDAEPGTFYDYSNIATALAGYLVEVVSEMPFDEYCDAHIFNPLCMNSSAWFLSGLDINRVAHPHEWNNGQFTTLAHYGFADYPNGQLRSNVLDLANFMIAYLEEGNFGSEQVLSNASIMEMLTPQVPTLEATQGLNWYTEELFPDGGGTVEVWGHNGGELGASTDLYIDPTNDIGIAVLSNAEGENLFVMDQLYSYALTSLPNGTAPACESVSVSEPATFSGQLLYPNPTAGILYHRAERAVTIRVFNVQGSLQKTVQLQANSSFDLSGLAAGLYLIETSSEDGSYYQQKVMLERY